MIYGEFMFINKSLNFFKVKSFYSHIEIFSTVLKFEIECFQIWYSARFSYYFRILKFKIKT